MTYSKDKINTMCKFYLLFFWGDCMDNIAIISAGGNGKRLWPISNKEKPKQFLNLCGNSNMINETIKRVYPIFKYDNIFIVINEKQRELAYKYINGKIPKSNIIIEPKAKNTAISIFISLIKIKKIRGNCNITVLSSDHYIENVVNFRKDIEFSIDLANKYKYLVSIGIQPIMPSTEYGYIKYKNEKNKWYLVEKFIEKPNVKTAIDFFESNEYLWNTGIFSVQVDELLKKYEKKIPQIYKYYNDLFKCLGTDHEKDKVNYIYESIEATSIDVGVLEKCDFTDRLAVIKATFKWKDIGTLRNFFSINQTGNGNSINGKIKMEDTINCNIFADKQTKVISIGIKDITLIKNGDICIICSNEKLEDIKKYM